MKKILATIIIGLIAAFGVGYFYFSNLDTSVQGTDAPVTNKEGETITLTSDEIVKGKNSIMSLFKLGKSMECTFSFSSNGVRGEGTGFFANGNGRVDSLYSGTTDAPTASYMITDAQNKIMYTWTLTDGVAKGVKIAIPDDNPENETSVPITPQVVPPGDDAVTPETDVEYNCKPWSVDNSVFLPPADVEFMDMTSMQKEMEQMQRSMDGIRTSGM